MAFCLISAVFLFRVYLAICSNKDHRGLVVQQGGAKVRYNISAISCISVNQKNLSVLLCEVLNEFIACHETLVYTFVSLFLQFP